MALGFEMGLGARARARHEYNGERENGIVGLDRTGPDRTGSAEHGSYITYNLKISLVPKLLPFIMYVRKYITITH